MDTRRFGPSGASCQGAVTGCSAEGGSGSSGRVVGEEGKEGAIGKRPRRRGVDGEGRLEFYLCDVGSTNGTYIQVIARSAVCLIGGFMLCFVFYLIFVRFGGYF